MINEFPAMTNAWTHPAKDQIMIYKYFFGLPLNNLPTFFLDKSENVADSSITPKYFIQHDPFYELFW